MIEQLQDLPLYRLELPTPFPVGPVNVYLVTEPEPLLLDTGTCMPGTLEAIEKLLQEAGTKLQDLRKIVVSHGHLDHYGLAQVIAQKSGAVVYASPLDEPHFNHREHLEGFYAAAMREAGVPEAVQRDIAGEFSQFRSLAVPLESWRPMAELVVLRCGSLAFQPVPTPGHTPGSTSFFEPTRRILISADTVLKHITPNPILDYDASSPRQRFAALAAYLDTLERVARLDPAIVYTGHGEPVREYKVLHARMLHHHRQRQELLLQHLGNGAHTVYELARRLFPDSRTHDSFLAISEVFAHLDLLEDEGRVSKRFDGVVAQYRGAESKNKN